MRRVGALEAKTHLSRLLSDVAAGETITITRRGRPIAELSPAKLVEFRARRGQTGAAAPKPAVAHMLAMDDMLIFRDDMAS
jgi:prevent-host-death family protein